MIFNTGPGTQRAGLLLGLPLRFLLAGVGLLPVWQAHAQATYFTPRQVLADFFPTSKTVTYQKVTPTPAQRTQIEARLGVPLPRQAYTIYLAKTDERIDGYAILDDENGQHLPISFGVKFSPTGSVERQEILIYRERYGDEIRDPRFRQQFVGKTPQDALRPGEDVIAVSGATISSRAMAIGVRRCLVLLDELLLKPGRALPPGSKDGS